MKTLREEVALKYMIQCENAKDFECPYLVDCPHEDNDICHWQLDKADEILAICDRENAEAIQQAKDERDKVATETIKVLVEGYEQKIQQTRRDIALSIFNELNAVFYDFHKCYVGYIPKPEYDAMRAKYLPESKKED